MDDVALWRSLRTFLRWSRHLPVEWTVDLFDDLREQNRNQARPLAARMRPRTLDEYVGQEHFLGPGKLLRRMLLADRLTSLISWPAGDRETRRACYRQPPRAVSPMNAVAAGIKEVRSARRAPASRRTRRTNHSLSDETIASISSRMLPDVEEGIVILIGATTQNPFSRSTRPCSRSQIFTFRATVARRHPHAHHPRTRRRRARTRQDSSDANG